MLATRFAVNDFTGGLVEAVTAVGDALAMHFPPRDADVNELSDAVDYPVDHPVDPGREPPA